MSKPAASSLWFSGVAALLLALACSDRPAPKPLVDAGKGSLAPAADGGRDAGGLVVSTPDAAVSVKYLSPEQLRDPETCKGCHPAHYREWASSMHAYAARDPVFLAMNQRGQRETKGALGEFCVRCHAPMAVADGLTQDGLNLAQLPDQQRGVSCYFCHNAVAVEDDHNGKLRVAGDDMMRGPLMDAVESYAHRSGFTDMFDHGKPEHNAMCGGCHDIVLQNGVELERTYREFQHGLYGQRPSEGAPTLENCAGCHMPSQSKQAAVAPAGAPKRTVHEHLWPGIDVALTEFPDKAAQRAAIEDCQLGIASVQFLTLDVTAPNVFTFKLETNAGHNQPSGAAQDRRMWLEVLAYTADGKLIDAASSGNIADGELEDKPATDPDYDAQLWLFRDRIFDAQGQERFMFWEAAASSAHPLGYEANTLPVRPTNDSFGIGTHFVSKAFTLSGMAGAATPARVTARLRMRPIGMDVLQDLVKSGDLDAGLLQQVPTFTFGAQLEWNEADGFGKTISASVKMDCDRYRCELDPSGVRCQGE